MNKTCALTISNPFVLRNFLFSGLAAQIENTLGYRTHFISPYAQYTYTDQFNHSFTNHYVASSPGNFGVRQPRNVTSLDRLLFYLHLKGFSLEYGNGSLETMAARDKKDFTWYVARTLISLAPRTSQRRAWLRELYFRYRPRRKNLAAIFEQTGPDLVVVGSPGHQWLDLFVMDEAKRRNIPVVCIIASWDNIYSRGPFHRRPDYLMVWSEEMKRQAVDVQQFPPDNIGVVGALQVQFYGEAVTKEEKKAMRRKIGLKARDKYIAYVCGARTMQYDIEDVQAMAAYLRTGEFSKFRVVVRPHPQGDRQLYHLLQDQNILLDQSPDLTAANQRPDSFNLNNIRHMASFLADAEFVVSSWGTTALLEACIFDKPAIQLRWMDAVGHQNPAEVEKVRKFQHYIHMRAFDDTGARLYCDRPADLPDIMKLMKQENKAFAVKRAAAVKRLICLPLDQVVQRLVAGLAGCLQRRAVP